MSGWSTWSRGERCERLNFRHHPTNATKHSRLRNSTTLLTTMFGVGSTHDESRLFETNTFQLQMSTLSQSESGEEGIN